MNRRVLNPALEDMPRADLLRLQEARLLAQVRRCYERIPFYRERWPSSVASCRSYREFKSSVPFTEKKEFVTSGIALEDRLASPGSRVFEYHLTSGTSGLGQEIHPVTVFDSEAQASTWTYLSYWAGLDPGDRVAYTFPIGLQQGGIWSNKASEKLGYVGIQLGRYSSAEKLAHMLRFRPHAVVISPSYLTHLTALCQDSGIDPRRDLPQLKAFFIAGENYQLDWVKHAEEFWACRLAEWYGLMQSGLNLAISCEYGLAHGGTRGLLHLMEQRTLCEILRPGTDEEVEPGENGELVITSLFREGFPVVRYRSGDRVRRSEEPCPCGRPFAGIEAGTVARYDDMMKIRGQNVWPETVDQVVFEDVRVAEYHGEVFLDSRGREQVKVSVEVARQFSNGADEMQDLAARLGQELKTRTGISMAVVVVPPNTLERFDFKVRRWDDRRRTDRDPIRYSRRD